MIQEKYGGRMEAENSDWFSSLKGGKRKRMSFYRLLLKILYSCTLLGVHSSVDFYIKDLPSPTSILPLEYLVDLFSFQSVWA